MDNTYKHGFKTDVKTIIDTGKGITEATVRKISELKKEPSWMLEFRMKAFKAFLDAKMPTPESWESSPNLDIVDFDSYTYFKRVSDSHATDWDDVDKNIKETFDTIGILEAEKTELAGVHTQFESESVYGNMLKEVEEKGVIFTDTDSALRDYPELFKEYFNTIVPYTDNKFAALNGAVWSGGTFIYIPKGVKLDKPLQSYFRINSEKSGQFERTLIIVDEGADVHYIEGCTAPTDMKESLHAAVVEIIIRKNAKCRYSTIQNWSNNILNLVTKRAKALENATMEWVDGNVGSMVTMKYPAVILAGEGAKGTTTSVAFGSKGMFQDAGAKMIHIAPNTSSNIISKSIARDGGVVNYRGIVQHGPLAFNARTKIECDTLLLDNLSKSDTLPINRVENNTSTIEHEATVSKVSEDQLFYLMSRGLSEEEATEMIIMGFVEPFSKELPMEYAVELNQLLKHNMEGSLG